MLESLNELLAIQINQAERMRRIKSDFVFHLKVLSYLNERNKCFPDSKSLLFEANAFLILCFKASYAVAMLLEKRL